MHSENNTNQCLECGKKNQQEHECNLCKNNIKHKIHKKIYSSTPKLHITIHSKKKSFEFIH